ncbi:hypothetical protein TNCV_5019711 [Trichonephila clavipes]|nr:hypothetical protein TNCV_5019711 [Trichonephila clavipes]
MLYYRNSENAAAAVRELRRLKKQRREPMSRRAVKGMIIIFEKTGQLFVLPLKGRKKVNRRRREYCYSGRGSKQVAVGSDFIFRNGNILSSGEDFLETESWMEDQSNL